MPPATLAASDPGTNSDKVIIQTYEGDQDTLELRLTATIVTSIDELRGRCALSATPAP
jgi:hypothetical protein